MSKIAGVDFESRHAQAFRDLNLAWVQAYFNMEPLDRETLFNPMSSIIEP